MHKLAPWLALLALSGCASPALLDERVTAPFAALVAADRELPARTLSLGEPTTNKDGAVFLRELRSGAPSAENRPVVVLLNGVFSDGDTWRFNTSTLVGEADVLVMDLPGTGRSAVIDPDARPADAFTLRWTAQRTWQALAGWQALQPRPRPLLLVGHSIAGTVLLRMLGDPGLRARFARTREQVTGAVLIAAADVGTPGWSPTLVELAKLSDVEVGLGESLGVLESMVRDGIAGSVERPEEAALQLEADRMVTALTDRDRRRASQLMLQRIRPLGPDEQPIWPKVKELSADHGRVDVPTLLIWGRHDDTLELPTGEKLAREIPGAKLLVIEGARHSVQQERPVEVSRAILAFAGAPTPR